MYYVYVLYDRIKDKFYIDLTKNLYRRQEEHKHGKVITTSKMSSLKLVYYEACISKRDAINREKQLKTGFGRGYLRRRLKKYLEK